MTTCSMQRLLKFKVDVEDVSSLELALAASSVLDSQATKVTGGTLVVVTSEDVFDDAIVVMGGVFASVHMIYE